MTDRNTLKLAYPSAADARCPRGALARCDEVQRTSEMSMSAEEMVAALQAAIPLLHDAGQPKCVEAVSLAIDRLDWSHLSTAPRDGTSVIVLFGGNGDWPPYLAFARWIVPEAGEVLNYHKRKLLAQFGGWWGSGRGKPHRCSAVAWLSAPPFPGMPAPEDPDAATGCADDQGLYAQDLAA